MNDRKPDLSVLPPIPAKRYFTIGEVSELCGVKPHVLRYWEQEFTQLKPVKRRGNRRYYQHHEVLLIRRIRELLYEQGFTISGARNRLADSSQRRDAAAHDGQSGLLELENGSAHPRPPPSTRVTTSMTDTPSTAPTASGAGRMNRSSPPAIRTRCRPRRSARSSSRFAACSALRLEVGPYNPGQRGVAQPGSALAWGARGREFESRRPDQGRRGLAG